MLPAIEIKITTGVEVATYVYPNTKKGNREAEQLLQGVAKARSEGAWVIAKKALAKAKEIRVKTDYRLANLNVELQNYRERVAALKHRLANCKPERKLKLTIKINEIERKETITDKYNDCAAKLILYEAEYSRLHSLFTSMDEPPEIKVEISHIFADKFAPQINFGFVELLLTGLLN